MRRLLIRPGGIGDCITCLPVMEWLQAEYTEVWAPGAIVPLIQFADHARSIAGTGIELAGIGLEFPASLRTTLSSFDEIVLWYGSNRPEFREAVQTCNRSCRFLSALPPAISNQHVTDFHATQVGAPLGLRPRIRVPAPERRNAIVIHPFSGGRPKNWPLGRFRELADKLPLPVEWTAGPEEELDEAHRFDNLAELARWLRGAALYIGNDSGITHLAAATAVPTLGLYRALHARTWTARGEQVHAIVRASVDEIEVRDVWEAATAALSLPASFPAAD